MFFFINLHIYLWIHSFIIQQSAMQVQFSNRYGGGGEYQFTFNDTCVSLLRALDDTRPYHQADI